MLVQSSILSPPPFPSNHNMDQFSHIIPTERSPRRELQLQGPRPTPLRINKDSHKIKKPPLAPQQPSHPHQPPPRQPIIIYTVSPKVIHTTPSDFMNLVQRLTGSSSSSSEVVSNNNNTHVDPFNNGAGMVSPAARYATIEKTMSPMGNKHVLPSGDNIISDVEGIEINIGDGVLERSQQNMFQGILSPGPASLSPIPSNFFSPPSSSDPSMVSFLHDLSPIQSGRNFTEGGTSFVLPSPSSNFSFVSPHTPSIDLFNYFLD